MKLLHFMRINQIRGLAILLMVISALILHMPASSDAMGLDFGGGWGGGSTVTGPTVVELGHFEMPGSDLVRIAIDADGTLYVTDHHYDKVYVLSNNGVVLKEIAINGPLGIAVAGGKIYVGSDKEKNVTVLDETGAVLYELGTGKGEFKSPTDIAVSADGRVFVVDALDTGLRPDGHRVVKVYDGATGARRYFYDDATGADKYSFGNLDFPAGIAIDEAAKEIYVTDNKLAYIFIYDLDEVDDYAQLRAINGKGSSWSPGQLLRPQGIALDADRIYIPDVYHSSVAAYTKTGTALGYVGAPGEESGKLRTPMDVAFDGAGKLFVTNNNNERIEVYGIDTYTIFNIDPSNLSYSVYEGGNVLTGTVNLTSNNSASWVANVTDAWVSVSASSGTTPQAVDITVDPTGLAAGIYTSEVSFVASSTTSVVQVTMEIKQIPAVLSVAPSQINFTYTKGDIYPSSDVVLTTTVRPVSWTATSSVPWLTLNSASGTTPATLNVSLNDNVKSLGKGTYTGAITIDAPDAEGSPVEIPVTLEYISGGTIQVSTNTGSATFNITDTNNHSYSGTGTSFTENAAPAGTYTIVFGDVDGFVAPDSYSLELVDGGTASFEGNYKDLRKNMNILATSGNTLGAATSQLNIFDGSGALLRTIDLADPDTGKAYWDNSIPASGDIDGDGVEEIIISHDVGIITGFEADGTPVPGLEFMPFPDRAYVDLAMADFDGDGKDEIVVSSLNWSANGATVRVFSYDGSGVVDTGVNFVAYDGNDWTYANDNHRRGARLTTGDVDGDGIKEILTVQGGGFSMHQVTVRMYKVDTSLGMGNWKDNPVAGLNDINILDIDSYYSDITAGDLDADGIDEIIISDASELTANYQFVRVMAFSAYGERIIDLSADSIRGVEVAAGDLDFDGAAEIIVGEGAFKEGDSSRVRVFDAQGQLMTQFWAFGDNVTGVRVATGEVVAP